MFTRVRQMEILAQAHANLAKQPDRTSSRQPEIVYKTNDNAAVPAERAVADRSASVEGSWQQWVDDFVDARLNEFGEAIMEAVFSHLGPKTKELKRENELLQREITQLREQVNLERGLRDLRSEVEQARAEVPKLPAIAQKLEEGQARLHGEISRIKDKVTRVRVDQSQTNFRLAELSKTAAARAAALEVAVETTTQRFAMREVDPAAQQALRDFAAAALKSTQPDDRKIYVFEGPTAGAA